MAGNDCAGSLQVCGLRVARLDNNGVPKPGANNLYVSDALVRLLIRPNVQEGQTFQYETGCGDLAIDVKDKDRILRYDTEIEFVTPDPELMELLVSGSALLTSGGNTRGWASPALGQAGTGAGVSLEAWTKAVKGSEVTATLPWWRHVLPRTFWRPSDKTLNNAPLQNVLVGYAEENSNFYNGPANDWAYTATSGRAYQYARDTAKPDAACGYQTLTGS